MAEVQQVAVRMPHPDGGEVRLTVVVETAQPVTVDGEEYPLVVALQIQNTTPREAVGRWATTGPETVHPLLAGENAEERIPPPRRVGLHEYQASVALGR